MGIRLLRTWWWKRGHEKIYGGDKLLRNPFALNAGTQERFEALVHELRAIIAPKLDDQVLDLGGGSGNLTRKVFENCKTVVITDLSWVCLKNQNQSQEPLPCIVADMAAPPFQNDTFSILFTYSTFPHAGSQTNAKRMIRAWDRLLKKGGTLYIGDIPSRSAIPEILFDALKLSHKKGGIKNFFALAMQSYHSSKDLIRHLKKLGYDAEKIKQPPHRRFHRYRFDIKAVKSMDHGGA